MSEIRWLTGGGVIGELQRKGIIGGGEEPAPAPVVDDPVEFIKVAPLPKAEETEETGTEGELDEGVPAVEGILNPDEEFQELEDAEPEGQVAEVEIKKGRRS